MWVKLDTDELELQRHLIGQGRFWATKLNADGMLLHNLIAMQYRLVGREQDAWLLRFALVHGIPVESIKDFQFTKDGEVRTGDDHEPTASGPHGEAGSREAAGDEARAPGHQEGDQDHQAQDGG